MAQKGPTRSILAMVVRNFLNSLRPRRWNGDLKGTDYNGTKYFEIPADPNVGRRKSSRWFEPAHGGDDNFDQQLPAEWEAWLRGRRKQPPSEEEIMKNVEIMKMKKLNAIEIEKKAGKPTPLKTGMESFPRRPEYELGPGKESSRK